MRQTLGQLYPRCGRNDVLCRRLKNLFCLLLCGLLLVPAIAQPADPDDEYLNIYGLIQDADSLSASGQRDAAVAKYQKAGTALEDLHKKFPNWNTKVMSFRMDYVARKLAELSGKPAGSASGPAVSKPPGASETSTPAGGQGVKLLQPGSEPLKALRLHPKAGDKQSAVMTIKLATATKIGPAETPAADIPPMKLTMDATVKDVSAMGDITYEVLLSDATVAENATSTPQVIEGMKAVLSQMKGLSATMTISDRGQTKDLQMKPAPGANPQTGQMVEQMSETFSSISAPLPDEEVGQGAKWQARTQVKSQGMNIDQTTTYELTGVKDDVLSIRSTISQHAANQKISNPVMPGLKMDLTQMSGSGTGTLTLELNRVLPVEGKTESHSSLAMTMNAGGQKQTMSTKVDVSVQLQAK